MTSSKSNRKSSNSQSSSDSQKGDATGNRVVYQEFGSGSKPAATERAVQELPANQQDLRVQASRKGRKGKTVTVISGFQATPETLAKLLKQLKTQCGSGGAVKDNTLEIQGDHTQKLVPLLIQMGYKAKISGG
ncbi:translation initiation factor [Allocoleopsis franciscana]|uniref:Translation initiation factor eIF-1/SUI1-like protein n=1 Tax=Allocoleopsis franciscana PCC 7113 TaxID=1173027 RepID=K9WK18_9CYAN|nr:translation initiation factor [Allocoleopsis franciscana]AFZ20146.1 translation initiation factor eIF-1/SUI1-like protein [Allocoleopsis franciscana PCC 7113]